MWGDGELLQAEATDSTEKRGDTVAGKGQAEPGKLGAAFDDRFRGGRGGQETQGPSILSRDLVHLWAKPARDGTGSLVLRECAMLAPEMVDEAIRSKPETCEQFLASRRVEKLQRASVVGNASMADQPSTILFPQPTPGTVFSLPDIWVNLRH